MVSKQILLPTLDSVKKFVNSTNRYDFRIELISDKYRIDAKSIMGILSLDRSKPLLLQSSEANIEPFLAEIKEFCVEE